MSDCCARPTSAELAGRGGRSGIMLLYNCRSLKPTKEMPLDRDSTDMGGHSTAWIGIVSGLPRSGTSLMMNMLRAGGMSIMSDGQRQADPDNPLGYFELERVKDLPRDTSWLQNATGKVVKIQAYLLAGLPIEFDYRIVFMLRNPEELVASQERMLSHRHLGRPRAAEEALGLMFRHLEETLAWLSSQTAPRSVLVHYARLVSSPLGDTHRVNAFFGGQLDVAAMQGAIDAKLYRQRGRLPAWSAGSHADQGD